MHIYAKIALRVSRQQNTTGNIFHDLSSTEYLFKQSFQRSFMSESKKIWLIHTRHGQQWILGFVVNLLCYR